MKFLDAVRPLYFKIFARHIKGATQSDKYNCVIAQALKDNPDVVDVLIGSSFSYVEFKNGQTLKYRTPKVLSIGLNHWDKSKNWGLPEGEYCLDALCPSQQKEAVKERAKVTKFKQVFKRTRKYTVNQRHIEFLRRKAA